MRKHLHFTNRRLTFFSLKISVGEIPGNAFSFLPTYPCSQNNLEEAHLSVSGTHSRNSKPCHSLIFDTPPPQAKGERKSAFHSDKYPLMFIRQLWSLPQNTGTNGETCFSLSRLKFWLQNQIFQHETTRKTHHSNMSAESRKQKTIKRS